MNDIEFGARIREYRKGKGLSIKTLAEQVNITPSMLSQIERDLANPSINTLKLLSNALNVPLFKFFTESNIENVVVKKTERKKIYTNNNNTSYEYELLTPDSNGDIEFVLQRIQGKGDSGTAVQSHDGEEVAYVLRGQLTLTLNSRTYVLEPGDSVRISAMSPHLWSNQTDDEAVLIFAITPPCF